MRCSGVSLLFFALASEKICFFFYLSSSCRCLLAFLFARLYSVLSLLFSFSAIRVFFGRRSISCYSITRRVLLLFTWRSKTSNGKRTCVSRLSDLLNLLSLSLEHDPISISSRWRSIGRVSVLSRSSALRVVCSRQRRILIDLSILQSTRLSVALTYFNRMNTSERERIDRSAMMNKRKELTRD